MSIGGDEVASRGAIPRVGVPDVSLTGHSSAGFSPGSELCVQLLSWRLYPDGVTGFVLKVSCVMNKSCSRATTAASFGRSSLAVRVLASRHNDNEFVDSVAASATHCCKDRCEQDKADAMEKIRATAVHDRRRMFDRDNGKICVKTIAEVVIAMNETSVKEKSVYVRTYTNSISCSGCEQ
jgi:hypothetical protein